MREMAKPAGFRINVQTMPHATYLDQVWKKGSFYVGFYNMQATADAHLLAALHLDAAWNETRWNNPRVRRAGRRGRGDGGRGQRRKRTARRRR